MSAIAIAFDLTPLQNAHRHRGIGTYVRGLASRLAEQTEVPIEFWGWSGDEPLVIPSPHRAVWLARMPMPQYRGAWLFAQLAMRRRASRSQVAAVHFTDPEALIPLAGRKVLATVYDLIPLKQGVGRRRLIARAGYQSYLSALKRADVLFAISEQTAGDLVELLRLPPGRIVVARPGVDPPPDGAPVASPARPYFLYLGGPNPNKNLPVLLAALAACPELPQELLIGGHWLPRQIAALEAEIGQGDLRGRVRHLGFVPQSELPGLMRGATAIVVPSLHEGFGLPVAEGLAAGALVIHSRLAVLEETSAGAALTFDARSSLELAACLRRSAGDPESMKALRQRGVERARALSWDDAVAATLATYRTLLPR